jgi:hypothetical protein
MTRTKFSSPRLELKLTEERRDEAIKSNSGACLIADAIKAQYPQFTRVTVDMATIRFSDSVRGVRYVYLTPPEAQHVLLSFDQGWPSPTQAVTIKRAVHITPITRSEARDRKDEYERNKRMRALEAKVREGKPLTKPEQTAMSRMKNRKAPPERPSSTGKVEVAVSVGQGSGRSKPVLYGGRLPVTGKAHPNLLRGRDRHFGAKLADPGEAFEEAVKAEVAARLAAADPVAVP